LLTPGLLQIKCLIMKTQNPLKLWRSLTGMKLREVAEAVGTTPATINRIEKGVRLPSPAMAKKIELATGGMVRAANLLPDTAACFTSPKNP